MEKSESIKELAIALNKAQATLQVAKKGSENPFFHSKYADLLAVWDACREALTNNGFAITQIADTDSEGRAVLETVLMHTSGEWIKGRLPLLPVKTDPQAQGSALTYARRYSLAAIVGLCTEGDDDAEGSMDRKGKQKKSEVKGHWCSVHQTPFFKKGKMKNYAHMIKDENGVDTGEWCNESKSQTEEQEFENLDKPEVPQKLGYIDGQWFRENLTKIQNNKGDSWAEDKLLNYITKSYHVEGETVIKAVANLGQEAAEHFVAKMEQALASIEEH